MSPSLVLVLYLILESLRSSLALSMAGQSVGAKDQWFEATTHTFNPNCASAAGDANSAALGRPALASQEELLVGSYFRPV